jgi:hypothetical protein
MFEIRATNLRWLETLREAKDHCLHGDVQVRIGDEIFSYENATVSASAFYLLRSLKRDHIMNRMGIQLVPCCGFDLYFWQDQLIITGCSNGVDWSVRHEDGLIHLVSPTDRETVIPFEAYRKAVCAYADGIKAFYENSQEKVFGCDEDREVYAAFWKEWHQIRDQYP